MKLILLFLGCLVLSVPARAAENFWSGLWRNADQRGERLLQHGDAAAAAKVFVDPRRKAYAEIRAGNYAQAAHDLAAFDDAEAQYNRGNALAHAGDLQGALAAYDLALKRDPHHQDAQKNRQLVEAALKQQPPPAQDAQNKSGAQNQHGEGKQGNQQQQNSPSPGGGEKAKPTGSSKPQPGNNPDNPASKQAKSASKPASDQAQSADKQQGNNAGTQSQQDESGQAKADAMASKTGGKPDKPASSSANTGNEATRSEPGQADHDATAMKTPSEQQLAEDQWLRNIPDDPGGLLRRKFLIEHLLQQNKSSP